MNSAISGRATSAFPLSVGTSLAVESVFTGGGSPIDPERPIPQHIKINTYNEFWFNLSTLFRNLYSAIPRQDVESVKAEDCAEALVQEVEVLLDLTKQQSNNFTKPVFYVSNYSKLPTAFRHANLRAYGTEKRKAYKALHDKVVQKTIHQWANMENTVRIFDMSLNPERAGKALIMTHVPFDLLSFRNFDRLDLLESHTGLLKPRNLWYTKYYGGKEMDPLPFSKYLLPVFGDKEFFHPMGAKLQRTVLELAIAKRWTFATTDEKILEDLRSLKDAYAAQVIASMSA